MFFYKELSPLVIASNVGTLQFSNIAVNASSSMTFTVSAASGEKTETVTLSDNTNQFEFSPSSFSLGEGGSQVVTVTFRPTSSMRKNGTITATSTGGSSTAISLSGSATAETRIPVGSALAFSSSVLLGGVAPLNPPNGSEGWYFNKTVSNTTKAEWNFYSRVKQDGSTVSKNLGLSGSNISAYMIVSFDNVLSITRCVSGSGPFINVYTQHNVGAGPNAATWYKSRINWYPSGAVANYTTGSDYFFYSSTDPVDIHPEIPANRRYKMRLTLLTDPNRGSTGSFADGQIVDLARVSTNSHAGSSVGISFTVRNAGTYFSDLSEEVVFLRSGSV
jgi:hypothetical protein